MRTKTLLLTAVLGVAGVAATTAQAQSVYSLNAVGYVNLSLGTGFTIIANPLNNGANDLNTILTNVPTGTIIYTFDPAAQAYVPSTFGGGTWHGNPLGDQVLPPGKAAFIKLTAATTITFVGNVPQGSLTNTLVPGFTLTAIPIPVSVSLTNSLVSLAPNQGDIVYNFSNTGNAYTPHTFNAGRFVPADYTPAVGEGFFYLNKKTTAITWNVNFSVN
jgi:hypothetical protein